MKIKTNATVPKGRAVAFFIFKKQKSIDKWEIYVIIIVMIIIIEAEVIIWQQ